ncbi:TrmH family RNA methyltransferase [Sulfuriferula nivalis]|uniref:RNA methyltransferase n=1 Tax=Sulfuriferula nivalis TaxID=2675298 RepID=A0A809SA61_9PROT|nr:RNA methyltransferase [Sulfuriferula nivalis]BBP01773.1 RNA methyltransferase [Sulfuriferula nivalis]
MITSMHNPQYKALKKLADSTSERRELGQTLLDGEHLLLSYLATEQLPRLVIVAESAEQHPLLARLTNVPVLALSQGLFNTLSPVKTPTGLLLLVDIPPGVAPADSKFIVLLEAIQDPGNLGTILRSAAAAGVDAVYLSAGCADAWSPKVLRGGMGAHFATQIVEHANLIEVAQQFNGLICATALDAPYSLFQTDLTGKVGFVIGNEGAGLSVQLRAATNCAISIPMPGQVESLNAAAALAVCVFERVRQLA